MIEGMVGEYDYNNNDTKMMIRRRRAAAKDYDEEAILRIVFIIVQRSLFAGILRQFFCVLLPDLEI